MAVKVQRNPWFFLKEEIDPQKMILFCFHYAGGNATLYKDWADHLPEQIQVCPIQLPGRGNRFHEAAYTDLSTLLPDLAKEMRPFLDQPFVFFGHSMGALISFELTRYLRDKYDQLPCHLIVSGFHAPHLPDPGKPINHLPDDQFLAELEKMNGTPKELIQNRELMELLLPLLRSDFALCEGYRYTPGKPLGCPITALGGIRDPEADQFHIKAWSEQTSALFQAHMLEGDHFFIHSDREIVLAIVNDILQLELRKNVS